MIDCPSQECFAFIEMSPATDKVAGSVYLCNAFRA